MQIVGLGGGNDAQYNSGVIPFSQKMSGHTIYRRNMYAQSDALQLQSNNLMPMLTSPSNILTSKSKIDQKLHQR